MVYSEDTSEWLGALIVTYCTGKMIIAYNPKPNLTKCTMPFKLRITFQQKYKSNGF